MTIDKDTMLRLLRGELDAAEAARVQSAIDRNVQLKAEYERVLVMAGMLASSGADSFGPYFAERVMRKIAAASTSQGASLYDSLRWVFTRLAAASLIAIMALSVYNVIDADSSGLTSTVVEAAFGMPSADIDNLYYLQGL